MFFQKHCRKRVPSDVLVLRPCVTSGVTPCYGMSRQGVRWMGLDERGVTFVGGLDRDAPVCALSDISIPPSSPDSLSSPQYHSARRSLSASQSALSLHSTHPLFILVLILVSHSNDTNTRHTVLGTQGKLLSPPYFVIR